jgi:hypothetical protein
MLGTPWSERLVEQLSWHWDNQLRPAFGELTDDEYYWEPVAECWSVRPRGDAKTRMAAGAGDLVIDWDWPTPIPSPVTTIAWRLAHLIMVFAQRNAIHFGGPPADYPTWTYAATAAGAVAQLDEAYARWIEGARSLDAEALERPIGAAEGEWADEPYSALLLHIHREAIHHGSEVLLLRDLYRQNHLTSV